VVEKSVVGALVRELSGGHEHLIASGINNRNSLEWLRNDHSNGSNLKIRHTLHPTQGEV
jgi:hypothetical protein